jgi:5-methylcytosine-specific restriction protein B
LCGAKLADMPDGILYSAARRVIDAGLAEDGSAFTPARAVWTASTASELMQRFVDAPVTGSESFTAKLAGQLRSASDEAVQLAGELMYLHLLAPEDIGGPAKRALVESVLAIASDPVAIPEDLGDALDGGFARVGTAYFTMRDRQLAFLVRFVQAWKQLPDADRAAALADPWLFRSVVDSVPINSAYGQRFALLHFAFPNTFEPIVSRVHRRALLAGFRSEIGTAASGDEDRDLLAIRRVLQERSDAAVEFYAEPLLSRWQPASGGASSGAARGWLVRGENVNGRNVVPDWLEQGYCSLAYQELPELAAGKSRAELDALIGAAMPEWNVRQRSIHVGVLHRFLTMMRDGDLVVTVDGPRLHVGTIAGPPYWQSSPDGVSNRRRPVSWVSVDPPLRRDQLSDAARDKLQGQMTVSDMGPAAAEIAALVSHAGGTVVDEALEDRIGVVLADEAALVPAATPALAARSLIDVVWLDETLGLLREKRQLVLYGPPGTGKTYLAQELALHITEQTGGSFRLVQFHPSYAYEDFFEGFRPQQSGDGTTISFSLEPGPLKLLAVEAAANPRAAFVLVVDEINRANLAKVFGELYFLLEYRDRSVSLQYSPTDEFRLPANLFMIGTMNTADRSIALVDAAMRRRFAWQGLFPGEPPVSQMLRRWLAARRLPEDLAGLLDALNERVDDRDSAIGPSYLMTSTIGTEAGLRRVWKHQILPLLEERHAGDGTDIPATYGIDALRGGTLPATASALGDPVVEETGEPLA